MPLESLLQSHKRRPALLFVLACGFFFGCQSKDSLKRQGVSGTVILEGQPLQAGSIEFESPAFISGAPVQDGKFTINPAKGIPPGEYLVRIHASAAMSKMTASGEGDAPGEPVSTMELIPEEYNEKSKETRTVEEGKANVFEFTIPHQRQTTGR